MKAITVDKHQTGEQTAAMPQVINGVNVDDLNAAVEAIKGQIEIAKCHFQASNRWVNDENNSAKIDDLYTRLHKLKRDKDFTIDADESPSPLGVHRSANPVESALAALANCLTTTLIYHAAIQGIKIESVESRFEGDTDLRGFLGLDETVRRGLDSIRVSFKIKADASEEKICELIELAQKRSGVFDMLRNGVPISVQLT